MLQSNIRRNLSSVPGEGKPLDHLKEGFFRHEQVLQQKRRYDNLPAMGNGP
jgi:hypothetical protein